MIELRFHKELYDGAAVDQAQKTYGAFAELSLSEESVCWVVQVVHADPARERRVASELSNFALGVTIERKNGARG